jgi:hypothetical protein
MKWDQCFLHICDSLFLIKVSYNGKNDIGTGFSIGRYKNPQKLELVLATAKHLLSFSETDTVDWTIQQFDWLGKEKSKITFKSNNSILKSPIRVHTEFDIGLVFLPKQKEVSKTNILRTIDPNCIIKPGTKVGWAGFLDLGFRLINKPQPYYFEGVISSVLFEENRCFYLIDGHNGPGVSGGPVWCWNNKKSNYDIIGVVSGYMPDSINNEFPGLCVFEAINPMLAYLKTSNEIILNII